MLDSEFQKSCPKTEYQEDFFEELALAWEGAKGSMGWAGAMVQWRTGGAVVP